jgi:DNA-binding NarL/FixJ family response regulator
VSPDPSLNPPKPGEAAARVCDANLVGFQVRDCLEATKRYRLTLRQRDVLFLSLCDICPKEIGRALGLKASYIRVVRQTVVRKLRTHDGMAGIRRVLADIARDRDGVAEEKP